MATERPGVPASTINDDTPAAPAFDGSVRAITMKIPASGALVMYRLVPFNTYQSPSRRAVLVRAPASEPESGSVRQNEAIRSPLASRRT